MGCCCTKATPTDDTPPLNSTNELSDYPEQKEPFWQSDGTKAGTVIFGKAGVASRAGGEPTTLPKLMEKAYKCANADKPALRVERPLPALANGRWPPALPDDEWTVITWKQYYENCRKAAKGFMHLGVAAHDAVNVFGFNSPEWLMAAMGAICCGAKVAGIYPTDTPDQVRFKSRQSGASVAVVENEKKLQSYMSVIDELPKIKAIVTWDCDPPEGGQLTRSDGTTVRVLTWNTLMKEGDEQSDGPLNTRIAAIEPSHCCALIYTSGTTGDPKAVMISHDNIIFESHSAMECIPHVGAGGQERILSYLPLSHVAGMMIDIVMPLVLTAVKPNAWTEVSFARPYDLKVGAVGDRLRAVKPTVFLGVPRVWEKIAEKMKALGAQTKGVKRKIATWAKAKGLAHSTATTLGGTGAFPCCHGLADKLVLSKIKLALGLDECKFGFTGAAPIATETLSYFGALGIQINEVYGMSECTGAVTWSTDSAHVWGSCGWAMPGCEVKIFRVNEDGTKKECPRAQDMFNAREEEQGEICFRGRNIMLGYMANPELGEEHVKLIQKKNADAIDEEGWLHSGDKGCMSTRGMVKITGRYKELIIGAGGENIAPVPIEDSVKKLCQGISNVMMVGDKRKFNVALVTLKAKGATGDSPGGDELDGAALMVSANSTTITEAIQDPAWAKAVEQAIVFTNKEVPNNASKIQRFTILPPGDFSVETGELTPTLKLKRGIVEKKHHAMIEKIYAVTDKKATYVPYEAEEKVEKVAV